MLSVRINVAALLAGVASLAFAPLAVAQNYAGSFINQGPAPTYGPAGTVQSADDPPNGTVSGAIQSVLANPHNASSLIVGATNGGIWSTQNGGATWTPLTDNLPSLSIASLAYNSTNAQTIFAGIGATDNGSVNDKRGGALTGILESTDGGASWSALPSALQASLQGKSVVGVAGYGSGSNVTILAATWEPQKASAATGANNYGLYKSVNGGAFALVNTGTGGAPPLGAATSLVGLGTAANPYYVSITADSGGSGVYRSADGGATWAQVLTFASGQVGRLAVAANGAVAIATLNPSTTGTFGHGQISGLLLSQTGAAGSWVTLSTPAVSNGNQADVNLAVAIDPNNSNIVYVSGDRTTNSPFTVAAYRVILNADGSTTLQQITGSGTANDSSVHADSRDLVFDASGRLILSGDGGIWALTSPSTSSGSWSSLNGNLSVREAYALAYDAVSHRLLVAGQDAGISFQDAAGAVGYRPVGSGDGLVAAINDITYKSNGDSILYWSSQELHGLTRAVVDSQGRIVGQSALLGAATASNPEWNFLSTDFNNTGSTLPFTSHFLLNQQDPLKIAIGTNYVYVTTDDLLINTQCTGTPCVANVLTNVGNATSPGAVSALVYGAPGNVNALLAGTPQGLYYSATSTANSLTQLNGYTTAGGAAPTSLSFGLNSSIFYAADGTNLWSSTNGGTSFTSLTSNLSNGTTLNIAQPTSLAFVNNNGVNALFVGGVNNLAGNGVNSLSPIAVALSDGSGNLSGWSPFGRGLPNTIANQMSYNAAADVLAVSLYGRGIWTLYDVTSYFATATVLQFGLANNDSAPDATQLSGNRNLVKYGTGTLTIGTDTTYTGSTTISGGTLLANASLASSSGLTVDQGATARGIGTLPATTVNGALWPGNNAPGSITVNDSLIFNAGSTYIVDASAQAASQVNVVANTGTGSATLGGNVEVNIQAGDYVPSRTFKILTAPGGTHGSFSDAFQAVSNFPFLHPSLSYDADSAYLTIAPGGFAQGGQTSNQVAVGAALDRSVAGASGDYADVIGAFSLLGSGQAPAAFDAVSGQNYAGFAIGTIQTSQLFMTSFAQQMDSVHAPRSAAAVASAGNAVAIAEACVPTLDGVASDGCDTASARWSAWVSPLGSVGTLAGNSNAHAVNFNIGGVAVGLDRRFDGGYLMGITAGYSAASQFTQGMSGQATVNTAQVGLYGSYAPGNFYVDALAGYARGDDHMQRQISVPGLASRLAIGQTSTDQFFGQLESGYRFGLGDSRGSFVTPFLRLQAVTATQQGFSESGAESLDLTVAAQATNSLRSILGAKVGSNVDMGWRERLGLQVSVGWSHDYADTSRPVTASFAGAPADPFTVQGANAPVDGAVLGLAAETAVAENAGVYLRYDGEIAGDNTAHTFSGGLRISW